ncbi:MAG: septum formation initiator family protein [Bacteroidaceae bacterium]|nr:septum formation initiator family protein [Bacteroidaceae bacterium]MBQ5826637.1 septum formation initiator family protein [Bacteroidaceae bacterium]
MFVAIILFIDSNSLWSKRELISQNDELRREIAELEEACRRDSARLEELKNDSNEIIRVAREIYFMKRSNEDVYIINE